MDLLGYIWKNRAYAAIGLVVALVVAGAGLFLTRPTEQPTVTAISMIGCQPGKVTTQHEAQQQAAFFSFIVGGAARLATTEEVLASAVEKSNYKMEELQPRVRARVPERSEFVEIIYAGVSEDEAKAVLSTIMDALLKKVASTEVKGSNIPVECSIVMQPSIHVEPLLTAELSSVAASKGTKSTIIRLVLVGGVALLVGAVVAIVTGIVSTRRTRG